MKSDKVNSIQKHSDRSIQRSLCCSGVTIYLDPTNKNQYFLNLSGINKKEGPEITWT